MIYLNSSNNSEYGEILTRLIKEKKMTQEYFYNKLGIAKPYFYDIIKGKINPPPPETQIRILSILKPKKTDEKKLLDIAAKTRDEIQADILLYLKNNESIIEEIRNDKEYQKFMGGIIDE